jgi:hypothetical protein
MAIVGLTHDKAGNVQLRRTVTVKVAIGLAPGMAGENKAPVKLDHFVLLKKSQHGQGRDARMEWLPDEEKMKKYGGKPRELWIVLLDDDPDVVFRTEYAWWVKTGKCCWGNGETATRRTEKNPQGEAWTPCANQGCPDIDSATKRCKPSGDLYFMLADYPALGTICRLHTSSYQSIREIRSALEDLRTVTGGRLLGLKVKLFVRPERNVFDGPNGKQTGTKFVLGLQLAAEDLPKLMGSVAETAMMFQGVRKLLGGRSVEIEDDDERAEEIAEEFNPGSAEDELVQIHGAEVIPPAREPAEPADPQRERALGLMDQLGFNQAKRSAMLGQYQGSYGQLIEGLTAQVKLAEAQAAKRSEANNPAPPAAEAAPTPKQTKWSF